MNIDILLGKTLTSVVNDDNEELIFILDNGDKYKLYHEQDCCESVLIEDIAGDLNDLVGSPLTMAEEVSENGPETDWGDTCTYTFYKFATIKGYVTVRWCGSSNGYYSESVSFGKA